MNHIFRVIWNHSKNAWQAVCESAVSRGKTKSARAVVRIGLGLLLGAGSAGAWAAPSILPTDGHVVAGSGTISQAGNALTINQSSDKMAIDWQSFSIGQGNSVKFVQPGASSVALNRVVGSDVSLIQGSLTANGQVYLINPNGILFSPTVRVDVGGLVASTLNLTNQDFLDGHYQFAGASSNAIVNQGAITAGKNGTIALIAAKIENTGTLTADTGNVLLGAGNTVTLDLGGPVKIQVDRPALDALIENGGAIRANGGLVLLTAHGASQLFGTVINNTGIIEAQSLANHQGKIALLGGMQGDGISVGGTLDASAPNGGDGGSIETSAASVTTRPGLVVKAGAAKGQGGTWLVDPYDYTINATAAANIVSSLNNGTNVTVTTQTSDTSLGGGTASTGNGDITVSSAIAKTSGGDATLTLRADRNINVNSDITSTAGKLNITLSAANASGATVGGVDVNGNLESNGGNILIGSGAGAQVHGMGYALNQSSSTAAVIVEQNKNILSAGGNIVINGKSTDVTGKGSYSGTEGGVYVRSGASILSGAGNLFITGESDKDQYSFGFGVEANSNTLTTIGSAPGGGFVVVNGVNKVSPDGAVGLVNNGSIAQITFTGQTVANYIIEVNGSAQLNSYTGQKTTGCATGFTYCGIMQVPGSNKSYLYAGYNDTNASTNPVINVFTGGSKTYDGTTAATNLTFNMLGAPSGYSTAGLNFSTPGKNVGTYTLISNNNPSTYSDGTTTYVVSYYPYDNGYTINAKPLTATFTGSNKVYDGNVTAAVTGTSSDILSGDNVAIDYSSAAFADKNAATGKTINISGVSLSGTDTGNYSLQNTSATATADITPKPVTVSGLTASNKVYDGTTAATISGTASVSGFLTGDVATANVGTVTGSFADKNAGTNKAINLSGITLTGTDAGNYTVSGINGVSADITPKALTVSGLSTAGSKVYDGTTNAAVSGTPQLQAAIATGSGSATDGKPYSGDTVDITGTATGTYNSAHVATASIITFGGLSVDNSNYTLTMPAPTSASITPATLTATLSNGNVSKAYDGTTAASSGFTLGWSLSGLASGDTAANLSFTAATYNSKDVSAANQLTVSGMTLNSVTGSNGSQAGDYQLASTSATITAAITPRTLAITGLSASSKVYDGTISDTLTGTAALSGAISGDDVSLNGSATSGTFANANAGTGKTVTADLSGLSLGGAAAGNYKIGGVATSLVADIGKASLTVSGLSAENKTYDGTVAAALTGTATLNGTLNGDTVTLGGSATQGTFADANVGTGKAVNADLSGLSLSGAAAGNYQISGLSSSLTANISKATLTISGLAAQNKVYDGTNSATLTGSATLAGIFGTDAVNLNASAAGGTFADANAGTNKAVTADLSGFSLTGAAAGNYQLGGVTAALKADISKAALTISGLTAQNKTYDGTTNATLAGNAALGGLIGNDAVSLTGTATSGAFADANAGADKVVTADLSGLSLGGAAAGNYQISGVTSPLKASISKASLTISGLSAENKTYDGTTGTTLTGSAVLNGVIGNDAVSLNGTAATGNFADANAGSGKSVTANLGSLGLTGAAADNYQIAGLANTLTADINKATLTVSGLTAQNKTYDGSTSATLAGNATLAGVIGNDSVTLLGSTTSGTFADANAGTGMTVTANLGSLSLGGAAAGNYQIAGVTNALTADINKASLTISGLTAQNKTYDGTISAALSGSAVLSGIIGSDAVSLNGNATSGTFADANAGTGKQVTANLAGLSLGGAAAGNYQISGVTAALTADIRKASLTVSGLTAQDKTYDGTTSAVLAGNGVLNGLIGNDAVSLNGSATKGSFADASAGTGKAVAADLSGLSLAGTAAGNYQISGMSSPLQANISKASLTVSGLTAQNKVYDGSTTAALTGTAVLSGVIGSDAVSLNGGASSGSFANANAGTGKLVTADLTGLTLGGAAAGNYQIAGVTTPLAADISKASLTVSGLVAQNKTYDGTTAATLSGNAALSGIIGSDAVTLNGSTHSGAFADANAGAGKGVTADLSDLSLGGAAAGNYQITGTTNTLSANIAKATLLVSGLTAQDKTYDGTAGALLAGTATLAGIVKGDDVILNGAATNGTFGDANAGTGKQVTANLANLALGGAAASNYQIGGVAGPLTADISKAALTVSGLTAQNKVYDGTVNTAISGTATLAGIIGSDTVSLSGNVTAGTFADANAGKDKVVTASLGNLILGGASVGNYQLAGVTSPLTAEIGKASLTVSGLTAQNKVYDGTTNALLTGQAALQGIIGNDVVSVSGNATSGSFTDANAGTGKLVAANLSGLSLSGAAAGNYQIGGVAIPLTADIGKASLTISGLTAQNKTYDGTSAAVLTGNATLAGVIGSDIVNLDGNATSGSFSDVKAGTGKLVTADLSSLGLTGAQAGNYQISGVTGPLTADVGKAALTVSGLQATAKTFDGTDNIALAGTPELVGVVKGDNVSLSEGVPTGSVADAGVGNDKVVNVDFSKLTLTGADAGNYQVVGVTSPLHVDIQPVPVDPQKYVQQPAPLPMFPDNGVNLGVETPAQPGLGGLSYIPVSTSADTGNAGGAQETKGSAVDSVGNQKLPDNPASQTTIFVVNGGIDAPDFAKSKKQ